jgi:nucleotide-binding universal stress UspA family protein
VYKTIVAAYDGSNGAVEALRHAAGLARLCDAELLVVTIYRHHSLLEASFAVDVPDDRGNMDEIMREHARSVAEAGRAQANEAGVEKVRLFMKGGQPARGIVAFAEEHGADLIVVGSRGLGSVEGFLVGSVSHKITSLADCPVLVV